MLLNWRDLFRMVNRMQSPEIEGPVIEELTEFVALLRTAAAVNFRVLIEIVPFGVQLFSAAPSEIAAFGREMLDVLRELVSRGFMPISDIEMAFGLEAVGGQNGGK
jgi:hypothetical protein